MELILVLGHAQVTKNDFQKLTNVVKTVAKILKLKLKVENVFIQLLLKVKITTKSRALKLLTWVKVI